MILCACGLRFALCEHLCAFLLQNCEKLKGRLEVREAKVKNRLAETRVPNRTLFQERALALGPLAMCLPRAKISLTFVECICRPERVKKNESVIGVQIGPA